MIRKKNASQRWTSKLEMCRCAQKRRMGGKGVVAVLGLRQNQPPLGISQEAAFYENFCNDAHRHRRPPPQRTGPCYDRQGHKFCTASPRDPQRQQHNGASSPRLTKAKQTALPRPTRHHDRGGICEARQRH